MNWRIDMELWGSTAIVLNESIVIGSRTKPTRDAGINLRSPTGLAIAECKELSSFCLPMLGALGGVKSELEGCRNGFSNLAENFS